VRKKLMMIKMCMVRLTRLSEGRTAPAAAEDMSGSPPDLPEYRQATRVHAGLNLIQQLMMHDVRVDADGNKLLGVCSKLHQHLGMAVLPDYLIQELPRPRAGTPREPIGLCHLCSLPTPKTALVPNGSRRFKDFVQDESSPNRKLLRERNPAKLCENRISGMS